MPFREAQRSQWCVMDTPGTLVQGTKQEISPNSWQGKAFYSLGALEKPRALIIGHWTCERISQVFVTPKSNFSR